MTKDELRSKLDEFIENEELEELADKTIQSYRNAVNKFIDYLPNDFEINKKLVMDWKKQIQEDGFALKSRNQFIVVVNKFLYFLDMKEYRVKLFKEQEKSNLEEYIEPQEHKRILR